jgi:hypothetical protein
VLIVVTGLAALVSLVFRYRRAGTVEREQLKWLVYAGGLIVAAVLVTVPIAPFISPDAANNLQNATSSGSVALLMGEVAGSGDPGDLRAATRIMGRPPGFRR